MMMLAYIRQRSQIFNQYRLAMIKILYKTSPTKNKKPMLSLITWASLD